MSEPSAANSIPSAGHQYTTPRSAYLGGAKAVWPFLFGTVPFGLVTGIATKAAGLSAPEAVAMTAMVFAGTAQIAAMPLLVAGAPGLVVVLTAFIINLRFMIYSATAAPYFRHLPLRWRFALGYFMTDTGFALVHAPHGRPAADALSPLLFSRQRHHGGHHLADHRDDRSAGGLRKCRPRVATGICRHPGHPRAARAVRAQQAGLRAPPRPAARWRCWPPACR